MTGALDADQRFMERALELARRGLGRTAPNPAVGCVLVRDGQIIGEGWHQKAGGPHAEVHALRDAGDARGATAYVTLEPCNHTGRTGPCTEALLSAGVSRVVAGTLDPNPRVAGAGMARLAAGGVETRHGVLEGDAQRIIGPFRRWILDGRPEVTLKIATSLDGRIATATGHSQWVTGPEAREDGHRLRDHSDAIMVGAGTVRIDDPRLTTRVPGGRDPLRIIVSGSCNLSPAAQVFTVASSAGAMVVTGEESAGAQRLRDAGIDVRVVGMGADGVDLDAMFTMLGDDNITSVMVEGGRGLATRLLLARQIDRIRAYVAPAIIGSDGLGWAGPLGIRTMPAAVRLTSSTVAVFGDDIRIDGAVDYGNRESSAGLGEQPEPQAE